MQANENTNKPRVTGRVVRVTDPSVSMERIYARIYEAEQYLAEHEAAGRTAMVAVYRRRIRSLRGAATRMARMMGAA